jgi:hypothetical protein
MFFVQSVERNYQMLSNKELTQKEFDVSLKIKIAMNCLMEENVLGAKEYLTDALRTLHD